MQDCVNAIISEEYADILIRAGSGIVSEKYCNKEVTPKWEIYYIPLYSTGRLTFEKFGYVALPDMYVPSDINVANESGVSEVFLQPALNLTGDGVIVGVIDTGIDYAHKAFLDANGNTRILSIWDQTIESNNPPNDFSYGTEYTQDEINMALRLNNPQELVKTTDIYGHGTFLTGIAAGSRDIANNFTGIAPKSDIVFVKLKEAKNVMKEVFAISSEKIAYEETDIMLALKYIDEVAKKEKKPAVILLGLVTSQGSHKGTSPLADTFDYYSGMIGRVLVTSAGNESNRGRHYFGKIGESAFESVELRVGDNETGFVMELWSSQTVLVTLSVTSPSGEIISRIPIRREYSEEYSFVLERTRLYVYSSIVQNASGLELVLLKFDNPTSGIWRIDVYGDMNDEYNMWLPAGNLISNDTYFLNSNPDITVTEIGNTEDVITIGAYDYRDGNIFVNSGRGYSLSGIVKPDLIAPGVSVLGPLSADTLSSGARLDNRNRYTLMTGTSVAAAVTTGAATLITSWEQEQDDIYFVDTRFIKTLLIRGAKRDANYIYPNNIQGYGKLDVMGVFEFLKAR